MLAYREALSRILSSKLVLPDEWVPLDRLVGRFLSEDVACKFDIPFFTNSAVDGYAVSAADLSPGGTLRVNRTVGAGDPAGGAIGPGEAVRIMTGAQVPPETAAVVMQEDVEAVGDEVRLTGAIALGKNIRERGREFTAGSTVLQSGTLVTPPVVSLIAGLGQSEAKVVGLPKTAVLATGDELRGAGDEPREGQVYESNTFAVAAALKCAGIRPTLVRVGDERDEVVESLRGLFEVHDVVVTCGGLSVGLFDHVRSALCELGFRFEVERVSIKPGKPFSYATDGGGKRAYCLPGNPMSALVTFALFVWPALVRPSQAFSALVASDHANPGDRTEFVPCVLMATLDGGLEADPSPALGSHALSGLVGCDALLEVPPYTTVQKGETGSVVLLPWSRGW